MQKKEYIPDKPLTFGLFLTKPFWGWAVLSIVIVVIAQVLETSTYYIFKEFIDTASQFGSGEDAVGMVIVWVMLYPVAAVGHSLMYRMSGLTAMQWQTKMQKFGRDTLFGYLSLHSHAYFADRFAGSLSSKIWHATDHMGDLMSAFLWEYLNLAVAFFGSLLLIYLASPVLAGVYIFWILVLILVSYTLAKRNTVLEKERSAQRTKTSGTIVDIITNITAVRQFARRWFEIQTVEEETDKLRIVAARAWLRREILLIVGNVIMGLFVVSMLAGAFWFWRAGTVTTGEFVMILTIMSSLTGWFSMIGNAMNRFAQSYGSIAEGLDELLHPHDLVNFPKARPLVVSEGSIHFSTVRFAYGTRDVFKDFELVIPKGQRVGLVGPSGSGKTTFVSLLLRQQDVHEGEVRIDGQNIRKVTLDSLRENIAIVPQEPALFHRSIRENIAYGNPTATEEEIITAAKRAQAHEFISELADGYDTLVGERGVKLSGGQRQRVAIARAILKNAPILVLDEATSSLDSESEVAIQQALHELMQGKTVIAIAHRLSTIKEMDRIIVLEGGKIAEDGTHDALVDAGGTYARLWSHQAGGFLTDA